MPDTSKRIAVGVIRKAHGVRGEASVEPWTDSPDRFEADAKIILVSPDGRETRNGQIESARTHGDRVLIKFKGIETPEDVQRLRGWTIEIPEAEARSLGAGEYFLHDLTGLHLIDAQGHDRGEILEAYEGGGGVLLNVRRRDGKEYEVPFAQEICKEIDLKKKTIAVELPEGIDED